MTAPLLPTINAGFNALSAALLTAGFLFIRKKNVAAHRRCMTGAFLSSVFFLAGYLLHHARAGHVRFQGAGLWRSLYLLLLLSHTVLAAAVVPLVVTTLALAARERFGAPVLVVDFGTAVTFDVVDKRGRYVGGIIAPGLAAMTDYLHEKTALLPRIRIREVRRVIGRNTEEAMLIGAVHGYRGLIRELLGELRADLRCRQLPVVATGGYARLISRRLPEISAVRPKLTLEGLRLVWLAARGALKSATE